MRRQIAALSSRRRIRLTDNSIVQSEKAVAATDDECCSKIGVLMLTKGGHAVDAAVAAAFDMRETAPLASSKDGQLAGVTGGSGGLYIIPGVLQVFLNHFILGMEPLAVVQSPRVYPQNIQYEVHYENWTLIDGDHIELSDYRKIFLEERGHHLQPEGWGSTIQLIVQNLEDHGVNMSRKLGKDSNQIFRGTLTAVGDARKDAKPAAL